MIIKEKLLKQTGDTLVEVMVAMAILAFTMAGAYILGNRALRTAVESNQRKEATAIAQGQIELLGSAYKRFGLASFPGGAGAAPYEVSQASAYCILSDLTAPLATSGSCIGYSATQYNVSDYWLNSSDANYPSTYVITVSWDNINGRGPTINGRTNQSYLTMYYRTTN